MGEHIFEPHTCRPKGFTHEALYITTYLSAACEPTFFMGRKVCYYYDPDTQGFCYGKPHVMKPNRIVLCHELIKATGFLDQLQTFIPRSLTKAELLAGNFHDSKYIDFLEICGQSQTRTDTEEPAPILEYKHFSYHCGITNYVQPQFEHMCLNDPSMMGRQFYMHWSGESPIMGAEVRLTDTKLAIKKTDSSNKGQRRSSHQGDHLSMADCPLWPGLFEFMRKAVCGGSVGGARKLVEGSHEIAVNWAGGLHHAQATAASGFCYVNDVVLAILELLTKFKRVLYIDFDCHHGDGVCNAFWRSSEVFCLSFHRYGDYFPLTGDINEKGMEAQNYSLNIPLNKGIEDNEFEFVFRNIVKETVNAFQCEAIVLQCGADSLKFDRLGEFNLSLMCHANCVKFCRDFNLPLQILGGGGYVQRNVATCWCVETAVACGESNLSHLLNQRIPDHIYSNFYQPDNFFYLPDPHNFIRFKSENPRPYLEKLVMTAFKSLEFVRNDIKCENMLRRRFKKAWNAELSND